MNTGMAFQYAFFYFFAALAVVSAVAMVIRRNVVHSAVFLITTLLATAGIFLQLRAEFLFVVQVILYVGGIMVLFVFVIMLVNLDVALRQAQFNRQLLVAALLALVLGTEFVAAFWKGGKIFNLPAPPATSLPPNTGQVAQSLFQNYMLPFEIASILLLVAMIGAVVMAQRRV
jgi:NADH-quinone oxidoreductase subunit J